MKPDFIEELRKQYVEAQDDASKQYLVAIIELPNASMPEIIINPRANFESKVGYYKNAYNELGVLKLNPNVRIVAFKFVHDLNDVAEFVHDSL